MLNLKWGILPSTAISFCSYWLTEDLYWNNLEFCTGLVQQMLQAEEINNTKPKAIPDQNATSDIVL